jgi:hypothetical protein
VYGLTDTEREMLLDGCPALFDNEPITDREFAVVTRLVDRGLMVASELTRPDPDDDEMEFVEYLTTALGRLVLWADMAGKKNSWSSNHDRQSDR